MPNAIVEGVTTSCTCGSRYALRRPLIFTLGQYIVTPTMQKYITLLIAFISFGLTQSVWAQPEKQSCSSLVVNQVGKYFGVDNFRFRSDNQGRIVSGACKDWPKNKAITIAAFAYSKDFGEDIQLVVAMVDKKGRVVSSNKGFIEEDAALTVDENSLWIDTARYDLSSSVRAFGIDITSSYMANCGDGGLGAVRTLYVQEGKKIRSVLNGLYMSNWRFVQGGNPRCMSEENAANAPETVIENFGLTIEVEKTSTNGYANLLVIADSSFDNGEKSKRSPIHFELRYDGREYSTKNLESALSGWQQ